MTTLCRRSAAVLLLHLPHAPTTTRSGATSKRRRDNNAGTWPLMLMAVPGMSADKAAAVARAYPTMGALRAADPADLANVLVPGTKKSRRLGPALAKKLAAVR